MGILWLKEGMFFTTVKERAAQEEVFGHDRNPK